MIKGYHNLRNVGGISVVACMVIRIGRLTAARLPIELRAHKMRVLFHNSRRIFDSLTCPSPELPEGIQGMPSAWWSDRGPNPIASRIEQHAN